MTASLGPSVGAQLLDQLGFLHVPGQPFADGRAYLFVALRRRPTLRHYDPERVEYWRCERGRGVRAEVDFGGAVEGDGRHSWGQIRIIDRVRATNDYVSFGGDLSVDRVDGMRIVVFSSEAPIFARGGHSQGWEPESEETAGFLASLRAAVGRDVALERRVSELTPNAVYSAFVANSMARYRATDRLAAWRPDTLALLQREAARQRAHAPAEWSTGAALADELLRPATAARA